MRAPDVPCPPTDPEPHGGQDGPDAALAAHLAADLDGGFAALMERHRAVVWSVARQFAADPADAEDLAADAFLRAYRALRGYDARRLAALRVRPWLLTILRNTARNAARDRTRRPDPPPSYETADGPASGPGVEQQAESSQVQRALGAALARLPEVQRTAVVLRHVVGLRTGEVAEVLGVAEGTAKSHVSRGLARLRPLVEDLREEGTR
ncbi:MAG: sigma-70 family RNA polymerase sigma factor [Actinomycetota bacterium]|nr:sigma-70 family RNA polymerase sigma factor [Actinomycetota bacterium]